MTPEGELLVADGFNRMMEREAFARVAAMSPVMVDMFRAAYIIGFVSGGEHGLKIARGILDKLKAHMEETGAKS